MDLSTLATAVQRRRLALPAHHSVLVGISGIDGSGKGFVAARLGAELERIGLRLALLNVDGWLNLPSTRFSRLNPAEHFYAHALRLDTMFTDLVLPLRRHRTHRLVAPFAEETATTYREHVYDFHQIDVVLLEGIFIFKRAYRAHFDLAVWIDCTFETALDRALERAQEGLPPAETIAAYETIYFPAQRLHFEWDRPQEAVDLIIPNDQRLGPRASSTSSPTPAPRRTPGQRVAPTGSGIRQ
jgi:uridine kinase